MRTTKDSSPDGKPEAERKIVLGGEFKDAHEMVLSAYLS
jgi:hypothetical protein